MGDVKHSKGASAYMGQRKLKLMALTRANDLFVISASRYSCLITLGASLIAQLVKNPPAMQETPVGFLGQEDLMEKG